MSLLAEIQPKKANTNLKNRVIYVDVLFTYTGVTKNLYCETKVERILIKKNINLIVAK